MTERSTEAIIAYLKAEFLRRFDNAPRVDVVLDREVWKVTVYDGCLASSADCTVLYYNMRIGSDDDKFLFNIDDPNSWFPVTVEIPLEGEAA